VTSLRRRIGRFEAPVEYAGIRLRLQRVRAVAAGTIAAGFAAGYVLGVTSAWFPAAAAGIAMVHALVRGRMPHRPIEPLIVDALFIAIGLGIVVHGHVALIAGIAYLIAVAITFGGIVEVIGALSVVALITAMLPYLPLPSAPEAGLTGEAIVWLTALVFLSGVALSLTAAATTVYHSRQRQREALDEVQRAAEMKNQFVSMVTHELRTPLTNIAGFTDTLSQTWRELPEDDIDEFLRIISSESEHLNNLVEDVLAIPRLEAGRLLLELTDFQLRPAAFKVADLLFPEGGDRSASVSIGGNVMVTADPNRVEQVLRNLLENARKYGGDQVNVEAIPLGDEWQIVVSDTGPGLPVEDRDRIFAAFEQVTSGDARTDTGFGLGLAVAKNLVEAMNGRIWYEPGFPVGARFCFTLPAAAARPAEGTASEVA
jgi:signal transduction histidine kinase